MRKYLFFAAVATVLAACGKPEAQSIPDEEIDSDKVILYQSTNGHRVEPYNYNYDTTVFGAIIVSNTSPGVITGTGSIKFDNTVTSIGDYAFYCSPNLRSITIPNSVVSIEQYAFSYTNLSTITLPDSLIHIGDSAFLWADLTSITLPNSLISIGSYAFSHTELINITLPDSLISIDNNTFEDCYFLDKIILGNNIKAIGHHAFANSGLLDIVIPDSVISIGEGVFEHCNHLSKVIIGKNVTTIGKDAFDKCDRLTEIYCKAQEPPVLGNETALGDPQNSVSYKIYVPQGAVDAYKSAWSNYSEYIVGYDFNALKYIIGNHVSSVDFTNNNT